MQQSSLNNTKGCPTSEGTLQSCVDDPQAGSDFIPRAFNQQLGSQPADELHAALGKALEPLTQAVRPPRLRGDGSIAGRRSTRPPGTTFDFVGIDDPLLGKPVFQQTHQVVGHADELAMG